MLNLFWHECQQYLRQGRIAVVVVVLSFGFKELASWCAAFLIQCGECVWDMVTNCVVTSQCTHGKAILGVPGLALLKNYVYCILIC